MLPAVAFLVAPSVVAVVTAAARTATRQRATMLRLFIWRPPESGGPVAHCESRRRSFGTDHLPYRPIVSYRPPRSQYQFQNWSSAAESGWTARPPRPISVTSR